MLFVGGDHDRAPGSPFGGLQLRPIP
jgi:hypothetical protein